MTEIIIFIITSFSCYLIGSISFGRILSKLMTGVDITKVGSGNTGATNVLRNSGPILGLIVLILDMMKSIIPVVILNQINYFDLNGSIQFFALLFIVGHCYPIYNNFKGGKGVATGIGPLVILFFPSSLAALIAFSLTIILTRYVSAGSILGCVSALASMIILNILGLYNSTYYDLIYLIPAISIIIYKHSENISRLINNNENKLSFKKK
ncbi:MAG: glycerol-3-phosphate 1-O-acyltransferase PlsY [Dehalococcoidia bacterium]|tara:strand:- start:1557 stop:2186 length:630 start_codon:yes stop_codon:yes gene_type:complete